MADCVRLEEIRVFRRLLARRCLLLSVVVGAFGWSLLHLRGVAEGAAVAICLLLYLWGLVVEMKAEARLDSRLRGLQWGRTDSADGRSPEKVVKSS